MTSSVSRNVHGRLPLHPLAPYTTLMANARLVYELCRRDITGRYRGSVGGLFWAFINPLLMLAIYSFVFGYIFKSRWNVAASGNVHFSIVLFIGLIVSNFFSECLNRAPVLITSNPNYVKKVVFPLETFSWVTVGTGLFHAVISTIALLVALLISGTPLAWTAVFFPLVMLIFLPLVAGLTWFLSALGVYFRDTQQIMMVVTTCLVFLAPVFYPRSSLPEKYQWLLMLNPLTFIVESARGLLLWGTIPSLKIACGYLAVSLATAWFGWVVFQTTRRGFADVI
jgi:lipopolysaccharide transport system permease protein